MAQTARNRKDTRPSAPRSEKRAKLLQEINDKVAHLSDSRLKKLAAELEIDGTKLKTQPVEVVKGSGLGPLVSLAEGKALLAESTVDDNTTDWAASELLGAGEMAARLDVARTTLDNWRTQNKVIAFRKGPRNFVYPERQFGRLGPVEGLAEIVEFFPSPEEAWEWLVTPNRYTENEAPIDRLKKGQANEVARAAEGANDFT